MWQHRPRVYRDLEAKDKYDAADEIIDCCSVLSETGCPKEMLKNAVKARERILSTGVGHGVAIMHGKLAEVKECRVALGYSEEGIAFDEKYPPVHIVFLIASNPERQDEYLRCVSSILSWIHDPDFRASFERDEETESVNEFWHHFDDQEWIAKD